MSGTPETDAAVMAAGGDWSFPLRECSRRLERQRDEAQEKIERQSDRIRYLEGATNHAKGTPLSIALRERDEAVEEIKEWETLCLWGGTPEHIHGFIGGQQTRIWHLECERDEARELLASEKTTRNHIIKRSVEVERERDKAREALMQIEDLFIDGENIYADREKMGCIAIEALKEAQ